LPALLRASSPRAIAVLTRFFAGKERKEPSEFLRALGSPKWGTFPQQEGLSFAPQAPKGDGLVTRFQHQPTKKGDIMGRFIKWEYHVSGLGIS